MAASAALHRDPGEALAAALSVAVHAVLAVFLFFGVRWASSPPESVVVELWDLPPVLEQPRAEPPPKVEPKPEPEPELKPEPKPEPKLQPKVEQKPVKPDIAVEKEKKPPPKKMEPKLDLDVHKRMQDQLAREMEQGTREREKRDILKSFSALPAQGKLENDYINSIRMKIKSNVRLPPDINGNPEAIFDVVQIPTGEVLSAKLRKSSGHKGYDEAVERAIFKSSPLPRPARPDLFQRELQLKFRPKEE